jgi:predicted nucleotide-binding protein
MQKQKTYERVFFPGPIVEQALDIFLANLPADVKDKLILNWRVQAGGATWVHESREEFFADYRRGTRDARLSAAAGKYEFWFQIIGDSVAFHVAAPSRPFIERLFAILDGAEASAKQPEPPEEPPTVFIGHGRNTSWRDLKDHLHDQHGYDVEAYEIGARAGHAIRDVLEDMLDRSAFALLILTAEDETADGQKRARQNVVHELGLFQGRLGFSRAIVLLEEGTEEFSNLQGIQQIRFRTGAIRETYGDVLATLRREFGDVRSR